MKFKKEEYFLIFNNLKDIDFYTYQLIIKLKLISNLEVTNLENQKIFNSYSKFLRIHVNILINSNNLFIKIKTSTKYINSIRKIIYKNIHGIKILNSEFYISNSLNFFKKFLRYENYLRKKIIRILSIKYGNNWWKNKIDENISSICIKRARFDNNKFHYIFYANFLDIKQIILKNWDDLFYLFNGEKESLKIFDKLNKQRNNLFHGRFDLM